MAKNAAKMNALAACKTLASKRSPFATQTRAGGESEHYMPALPTIAVQGKLGIKLSTNWSIVAYEYHGLRPRAGQQRCPGQPDNPFDAGARHGALARS